jgi:FkbM family methyltransferase
MKMHTIIADSYKLKLFRNTFAYLKDFGLKFTAKCFLDFLGVKNYSMIEYPLVGIKAEVRSRPRWKRLERGQWELDCLRHISTIVRKGQTILDVGAGFGMHTLILSKLVQGRGQVHAFEPNPRAFEILRDNVERNNLTNIYIRECGMSNCVGKTYLKARGPGAFRNMMSTLVTPKGQTATDEIAINITTIDDYCKDNGIHPDGIKIDVEGAEELVIEGGQDTIAKCSPWTLLEFHGHLMSKKKAEMCWHKIVDRAKEVTFIAGESDQYHYGDKLNSMPDFPYFHVFIEY